MIYKDIVEATFLRRINRFLALVEINGVEELVHVKNTGRCKELFINGAKVFLEDNSWNLSRKTKYSLISIYKGDILINIDSQVPNLVVSNALKNNLIGEIKNVNFLKRESTFKNSRFDIYFESPQDKGYIEVKGVTLENKNISMFPDAPTSRGNKHINELILAKNSGFRSIVFFLVQMDKPLSFSINKEMDPLFYQSVKKAYLSGVEFLVYDSIVSKDNIKLGKKLNFIL